MIHLFHHDQLHTRKLTTTFCFGFLVYLICKTDPNELYISDENNIVTAFFRLHVGLTLSLIIKGKNVQSVRDVCLTAVTLGAFYTKYDLEAKRIDAATILALGGERDDQKTKEIKPDSLRVLLECFTDKRFLEVVDDVESGRLKERLEKEFLNIEIKVEGLQVEIENMEEVKEWKEQM